MGRLPGSQRPRETGAEEHLSSSACVVPDQDPGEPGRSVLQDLEAVASGSGFALRGARVVPKTKHPRQVFSGQRGCVVAHESRNCYNPLGKILGNRVKCFLNVPTL